MCDGICGLMECLCLALGCCCATAVAAHEIRENQFKNELENVSKSIRKKFHLVVSNFKACKPEEKKNYYSSKTYLQIRQDTLLLLKKEIVSLFTVKKNSIIVGERYEELVKSDQELAMKIFYFKKRDFIDEERKEADLPPAYSTSNNNGYSKVQEKEKREGGGEKVSGNIVVGVIEVVAIVGGAIIGVALQ